MFFSEENGVLTARSQYETLRIEAWGKDALRVRATQYSGFSGRDWALSESPDGGPGKAKVEILEGQKIEMGDVSFVIRQAVVTNGRISVRVNPGGVLFFLPGRGIDSAGIFQELYGKRDRPERLPEG